MRRLMAAASGSVDGIDVRIEYDSPEGGNAYTETGVWMVEISDAGVLILTHSNGIVVAISPTGWTRVSKA